MEYFFCFSLVRHISFLMYEEFGEFQFVKLVDDINLEKIND